MTTRRHVVYELEVQEADSGFLRTLYLMDDGTVRHELEEEHSVSYITTRSGFKQAKCSCSWESDVSKAYDAKAAWEEHYERMG